MEQEDEETGSPPDLRVDDDPDLSGEEHKQVGGLAWRVYRTYWVAVGGLLAASILMSLLLMQGVDWPSLQPRGALDFDHTFIHCTCFKFTLCFFWFSLKERFWLVALALDLRAEKQRFHLYKQFILSCLQLPSPAAIHTWRVSVSHPINVIFNWLKTKSQSRYQITQPTFKQRFISKHIWLILLLLYNHFLNGLLWCFMAIYWVCKVKSMRYYFLFVHMWLNVC